MPQMHSPLCSIPCCLDTTQICLFISNFFFFFFFFFLSRRAGWTWRTVLCTEMFWHIGPASHFWFWYRLNAFHSTEQNTSIFLLFRLEADKAWDCLSGGPGMKRRQARRASRQMAMIFIIGSLRKVDARIRRCKQRRRRSCKGEASLAQSQNNYKKKKSGNLLRVVCTSSEERSFMNYSWSTEKAEKNTH